jgi:glutaredoxin-like protein NrdH
LAAELIIYSTPACAPCESLKRILISEGLRFQVKDLLVDEEAATLMEQHGIRSVPVLSVDGELHYGEGLELHRLAALLDL